MTTRQAEINAFIRQDNYAKLLGVTIEEIGEGYARVVGVVSAETTNFHAIGHGGYIFSLADIAFACASNSRGQTAVALDMTISYTQPAHIGDQLVAECTEIQLNGPIGLYEILVTRQETLIAKVQATVYRKKAWFVDKQNPQSEID